MKKIAFLFMMFVAFVPAVANKYSKVEARAEFLYENGDFEEAKKTYLELERLAASKFGENSSEVGVALAQAGLCDIETENYKSALYLMRKAYDILEDKPEVDSELIETLAQGIELISVLLGVQEMTDMISDDTENEELDEPEEAIDIFAVFEQAENRFEEGNYLAAMISYINVQENLEENKKLIPDKSKREYVLGYVKTKIGLIYFYEENYAECLDYFAEAEKLLHDIKSEDAKATLAIIDNAFSQMEEMLASQKNKPESKDPADDDNWEKLKAEASSRFLEGDFDEAINLTRRAADIIEREKGTDNQDYVLTMSFLGYINYKKGDYDTGYQILSKSLADLRQIFNETDYPHGHPYLSDIMISLGGIRMMQGRYPEAEKYCVDAVEMTRGLVDRNLYPDESLGFLAQGLNSLGGIYLLQARYDEAVAALEESLSCYRKYFKNHYSSFENLSAMKLLSNIGTTYHYMGDVVKAEKYFLEALATARKVYPKDKYPNGHRDLAKRLNNLGEFYLSLGKLDNADRYLIDARKMYENTVGKNDRDYAKNSANIGVLHYRQGDYEKASEDYASAIGIYADLFPDDLPGAGGKDVGVLYVREAQARAAAGDYEKALDNFSRAFDEFEAFYDRNSVNLSQKEKDQFAESLSEYYDLFYNFLYKVRDEVPGAYAEAVDARIFNKGKLLRSSQNMRRIVRNSGDSELLENFDSWIDLRKQIAALSQMTESERELRKADLSELSKEANRIEKKLYESSAAFADAADKREYDLSDLRKALSPGEAAVEFVRFRIFENEFWTDEIKYLALIVKPDDLETGGSRVSAVFFESGSDLETIDLHNYREKIKNAGIDLVSYEKYFKPIADVLQGYERIYLSADGVYHKISLPALYNDETGLFLADETEIVLVGNVVDAVDFPETRFPGMDKTASLYGNPDFSLKIEPSLPRSIADAGTRSALGSELDDFSTGVRGKKLSSLPGTAKEVEKIAEILTTQGYDVRKYLGAKADEKTIKSEKSPSILHIATHGFFLPKSKAFDKIIYSSSSDEEIAARTANSLDRSFLCFSGSERTLFDSLNLYDPLSDGLLTAREIMQTDLSGTDLAVLSACKTGLGDVKNGEGVYGLQRAFAEAGVKTLIMSLWEVPDQETQELMTRFYNYLFSGYTVRKAFDQARNDVRYMNPEPYYWAGFVIVGG